MNEEWADSDLELGSETVETAYKFGRRHTPFTHLLRGILWRKKLWCTNSLNKWLDRFNPECVFLAFSDDFFIPQIALYVAMRYNIPIISCIGDDYYFNQENTLNLVYHIYKNSYRKLIDKVLSWPGSAIYICDKIRDKYNAEFGIENVGQKVELYGWVQKKRDLGGLVFIDLRDRSGIIQLIVRPENKFYDIATSLKSESVIKVVGKISERESKNPKIPTGDIEVIVDELELINQSADIPFEISDNTTALEDTRLKYRYLDIRRESIKNNLMLRHKVTMIARNYLSDRGFIEVETPILCVPTPEGARDYLVPSRLYHGHFYALPQSPQIFKQLLMIGGMAIFL